MKREHILALDKREFLSNFHTSDKFGISDGVYPNDVYVDPQDVFIGHREKLDNLYGFGDLNSLQPIGYGVVHCLQRGFLVYKRKGTETRLDDKLSIGFGGHTSVLDVVLDGEEINFYETVQSGLIRELKEEIVTNGEFFIDEYHGCILSSSSLVDSLHVGFLYTVSLSGDKTEVSLGDHGKEIFWVKDLDDIDLNQCEKWTQLAINHFKFYGVN
jgi:predicted NUDIX family phosphoesterase